MTTRLSLTLFPARPPGVPGAGLAGRRRAVRRAPAGRVDAHRGAPVVRHPRRPRSAGRPGTPEVGRLSITHACLWISLSPHTRTCMYICRSPVTYSSKTPFRFNLAAQRPNHSFTPPPPPGTTGSGRSGWNGSRCLPCRA